MQKQFGPHVGYFHGVANDEYTLQSWIMDWINDCLNISGREGATALQVSPWIGHRNI